MTTSYSWSNSNNNVGFTAQEVAHAVPLAVANAANPAPGNIVFHTQVNNSNKELLRISKDGITAPSDVPIDEAATLILETLNDKIKTMIVRSWVKLDDEQLRECYSKALQYDIDLATVIQDTFIAKNEQNIYQGETKSEKP